MSLTALRISPLLVLVSAAGGIALAPTADADCNTVTNSTLCASGTVTGSSGAPEKVPSFNPYPCYGTPGCEFYDIYNPGIVFDLSPDFNRPRPR